LGRFRKFQLEVGNIPEDGSEPAGMSRRPQTGDRREREPAEKEREPAGGPETYLNFSPRVYYSLVFALALSSL
jgi:hypothetical protein